MKKVSHNGQNPTFQLPDPRRCSLCLACVNACPVKCISLTDAKGFPEIAVDGKKCLQCGKCADVCPVSHPFPARYPVSALALRVRDAEVWERSSSGGAFTLLAQIVLSRGGVVFGAAFNDDWSVSLRRIDRGDQLDLLRRSKYVWSDPGENFRECRELLEAGKEVLFSGLPCQIAGLKHFLGREYRNLVTVDMICHGTPPPKIWMDYLAALAARHGKSADRITEINFRAKKNLDSTPYSFSCRIGGEFFMEPLMRNDYLCGFLQNLFLRDVCHRCPAKKFRSGADYTLADFWGGNLLLPEKISGSDRFSLLFIHNDTLKIADRAFSAYQTEAVDIATVLKFQSAWEKSVSPHPHRKRFFRNYHAENILQNIAGNIEIPGWYKSFTRLSRLAGAVRKRIFPGKGI